MSVDFIYYVDPENGNVKLATDLIGGVHHQYIKLYSGTPGSLAAIPGDATNGLYTQQPQVTYRVNSIYADDGSDRYLGIGAIRMDDPQFQVQGALNLSKVVLTTDPFHRLNVTSLPFSGMVMAYDANQTEVLKQVVPKHQAVGFSNTSATLVTGAAGTFMRVLQLFLTFSAATGVKIYFYNGELTEYLIGGAGGFARVPANGQINIPFNPHGIMQTANPEASLVIVLSDTAEVAGFVDYLNMPET